MCLILNIDTATERAGICLAREEHVLLTLQNETQKDHASWLHVAIQQLLGVTGYSTKDLQAIAVTAGPGSYTGLRVGMAAAKGMCYALQIPLITESTLKVMACAAREQYSFHVNSRDTLFCPMIDARRMEVFTALYNSDLHEVRAPAALVLDETAFEEELAGREILFFGSGSPKWEVLSKHPNARFQTILHDAGHLSRLSLERFRGGKIASLAYSEPVYLKEFYTYTRK